jgi:hypothetical protein
MELRAGPIWVYCAQHTAGFSNSQNRLAGWCRSRFQCGGCSSSLSIWKKILYSGVVCDGNDVEEENRVKMGNFVICLNRTERNDEKEKRQKKKKIR